MIVLAVFVFGAMVGSFLNVCIYRLPWEKSIFWPASHCPKCLQPVRWYDNIPIASYFLLRGRCRDCGAAFSPRYALVEALTAALFGFVFWLHVMRAPAGAANHWGYAYHMMLIAALIVATFIDLDLQIIPDSVTVPGMLIGLLGGVLLPAGQLHPITLPAPPPTGLAQRDGVLFAVILLLAWSLWIWGVVWQVRREEATAGPAEVVLLAVAFLYLAGQTAVLLGLPSDRPWPGWPAWFGAHPHWQGLATSVVGLLAGAGLVWFVRVVGTALLGKEAMGFGDVTLMAMVGAFLGWQPVVLAFLLAPFFGLLVGLVQWIVHRENVLPYGPYLSLATLAIVLMWGPIWAAAQGHFRVLAAIVPVPIAILVFLPILLICLFMNQRRAARAVAKVSPAK